MGLLLSQTMTAQDSADQPQKNRSLIWEKAIVAFEKQDATHEPTRHGVLFLGSSSIRMWDLEKWFPGKGFLNRGFGGSEIADSIYYFDRLVRPYDPSVIVFYAGDNDIAHKKSPQQVFADFQKFADLVEKNSNETEIIFVAIKPSIARWKLVDRMRKANQLIRDYAVKKKRIHFADIDTPMIGKNGQPKKELFVADGLHLNQQGYQVWFDGINPLLTRILNTQN